MSRIAEDASVNIVGSLELFLAAARASVRKIVFASSGGTVYGNAEKLPIEEKLPPNPVSAYGVSKVAVERYLQLAAFHNGFTGISLRISNPYGPYQLAGVPIGVIANFIRQLRAGEPLRIYGDGSVVRDYIWIDDVAHAVVMAVQKDLASGEYNIGSEIGHSINEIASSVENAMGIRTSREYVSDRSFDARKVVLSTAKFRRITSWTPHVSLGEGIERMTRVAQR
jgi:UDP-glucose 4-epimerase